MSDYAAIAARAVYAASGHGIGMLSMMPIEGRANPRVVDFEKYRARKAAQQAPSDLST